MKPWIEQAHFSLILLDRAQNMERISNENLKICSLRMPTVLPTIESFPQVCLTAKQTPASTSIAPNNRRAPVACRGTEQGRSRDVPRAKPTARRGLSATAGDRAQTVDSRRLQLGGLVVGSRGGVGLEWEWQGLGSMESRFGYVWFADQTCESKRLWKVYIRFL